MSTLSSFRQSTYELFLGNISFWFETNPIGVGQEILARVKHAARLLAHNSELKRSKALECVAESVSFQTWHSLSSHIERAKDFINEPSAEWLNKLKSTLFLLCDAHPDVPLRDTQIKAFEAFAKRLSNFSGCGADTALDKVCAGLCGAACWKDVLSRAPENTKTPLYHFEVNDNASEGWFVESMACTRLIEQMDSVYQGAESSAQIAKAKKLITRTLGLQPGFLEAKLCLAQIQFDTDEFDYTAALATISAGVKEAESLIPKGFRGKLHWGYLSNRFYHRMLWLRMSILFRVDRMSECISVARKMLRLNPSDNLGVRYLYPLFLLDIGQSEKALMVAKFRNEGNYDQSVIRAFCFYATGNSALFVDEITKALFNLPVLRFFLLGDFHAMRDMPRNDAFRAVIPDLNTFFQFAWPVYLSIPGLQEACTKILSDPLVITSEVELERYWKGFWQKHDNPIGDYNGWSSLKSQFESKVSQHFSATSFC